MTEGACKRLYQKPTMLASDSKTTLGINNFRS